MLQALVARAHVMAAVTATAVVITFLASGAAIDLAGDPGDDRVLRGAVLLGVPLLIACLASAGLTGRRLAQGSWSAIVRRKQRRLQAAAVVGLVVLVPCAVALYHLRGRWGTSPEVVVMEALELVAGAFNLWLLVSNFRDGRRMARRQRKPARRLQPSSVGL
jgi:hypothetical protein